MHALGGWIDGWIDGWVDGWMDGWTDRWMKTGWMDWNWKTLVTHGNFIKIHIYGNIYTISVLPKTRAFNLFTSIFTTQFS